MADNRLSDLSSINAIVLFDGLERMNVLGNDVRGKDGYKEAVMGLVQGLKELDGELLEGQEMSQRGKNKSEEESEEIIEPRDTANVRKTKREVFQEADDTELEVSPEKNEKENIRDTNIRSGKTRRLVDEFRDESISGKELLQSQAEEYEKMIREMEQGTSTEVLREVDSQPGLCFTNDEAQPNLCFEVVAKIEKLLKIEQKDRTLFGRLNAILDSVTVGCQTPLFDFNEPLSNRSSGGLFNDFANLNPDQPQFTNSTFIAQTQGLPSIEQLSANPLLQSRTRAQLHSLLTLLSSTKSNLESTTISLQEKTKQLEDAKKRLSSVEDLLTSLEKDHSALVKQHSLLIQEHKDLEEANQSLQQAQFQMQEILSTLQNEISSTQTTHQRTKEQLKHLMKTKAEIMKELNSLDGKIRSLEELENKVLLYIGVAGIEMTDDSKKRVDEIVKAYLATQDEGRTDTLLPFPNSQWTAPHSNPPSNNESRIFQSKPPSSTLKHY